MRLRMTRGGKHHQPLPPIFFFERCRMSEVYPEKANAHMDKELRMPFGKHKGACVRKLPKDYCKWMLDNGLVKSPDLRRALCERIGIDVAVYEAKKNVTDKELIDQLQEEIKQLKAQLQDLQSEVAFYRAAAKN